MPKNWNRVLVRTAIYLFATIMDVVVSSVLFVGPLRAAELGSSALTVSGLAGVWSATYLFTSLWAGSITTRRNVGWLLIGACLATAFLSGGYICWPGMAGMFAITALMGVTAASFFTPFQVFMKYVDEGLNKGIARSSGLYVFSWSIGFAMGPFIAGFMWKWGGWNGCHLFNGAAAMAMAVGILLLKHHADANPYAESAESEADPAAEPAETAALPDLAWMAWVFGGIGCMVVSMVRNQFPLTGLAHGLSAAEQGVVLFVLSGAQAVVGFALGWSRRWMYRPWPVLGFGLVGMAGLILFAADGRSALFWPAAVGLGAYCGSFYFYFVYHSLIHPTRSGRYVSINEAVVGVAGVAGPAAGGLIADHSALWVPYAASAGLVLATVAVQAVIHGVLLKKVRRARVAGRAFAVLSAR